MYSSLVFPSLQALPCLRPTAHAHAAASMSASRLLVAGISLTTAALLRWVVVQSQRVSHEIDLHTASS